MLDLNLVVEDLFAAGHDDATIIGALTAYTI